ncbi:response regulator transcription factor [Cryobacterium adonitolivorans]|uniref:Response regulator transcription factor n=1 Tax=Cryobacterium adonitolivorans TaxID=1259189 RepID=A0A4R8WBL9_9MICO|nr:response regulator transcription factor [Cryobacterium adonitolivorans]TFC05783.1 response regulator transcription factor [Cryobacterium adonitolivorans]
MIRVLLADDHPVVRAGLRALLGAEPDLVVELEAGTAEDAVALAISGRVDVVLMDLQFGGAMQGAEATRRVRSVPGAPHVLVLTNYDTDADILGAIEAGASGYLLKDAPPAELVAAVRAAAAGQSALAPAIVTRLADRSRIPESRLSPREVEVLGLVAAGRSNRQIGQDLFLSEATVKSHLVHIFGKLGVGSRTSAVASARASGTIRGA